jgi:hypothetical protein
MLFIMGSVASTSYALGPDHQSITQTLNAKHTIGLLQIKRLDKMINVILKIVHDQPQELKEITPSIFKNITKVNKLLGFDPSQSSGWDSIGLDSTAGLSIILDDRLTKPHLMPLFAIKITHENRFLETLRRLTKKPVTIASTVHGIRILTMHHQILWLIQQGDYTFLTPEPRDQLEISQANLITFTKKSMTHLAGDQNFKKTFRHAKSNPYIRLYISTLGIGKLLKMNPKLSNKSSNIDFYAQKFPALGLSFDHTQSHLQLLANDQTHHALTQIFQPIKNIPLAQYIPANWSSYKISLNLKNIFAGLKFLFSPSMPNSDMIATMVKGGFAVKLGIPWDTLTQALGGHLIINTKLDSLALVKKGPQFAKWYALLSVGNHQLADQMISKLVNLVAQKFKTKVISTEITQHTGMQINIGPMSIIVIRVGGVIMIAPSSEIIKLALTSIKTKNLAQTSVGKLLDQAQNFYALALNTGDLVSLVKNLAQIKGKKEHAITGKLLNKKYIKKLISDESISFVLQLDQGIRWKETSYQTWMRLLELGIAVAIPSFMKYQAKARTIEARMMLNRISQSARMYYKSPHTTKTGEVMAAQFPPSTSLTPSNIKQSFCATGRYHKSKVSNQNWNQAGWKALNFVPKNRIGFAYEFISSGVGGKARFTARATGDLDCDGVVSTFEQKGRIDSQGNVILVPLKVVNELE